MPATHHSPNRSATAWGVVWLSFALGASLLLGPDPAAVADGLAGGAAPYLRDGLGARLLGMGNAGTAASADAMAAYWNPAALVRLGGSGISSQTGIFGDNRAWNFLNYACDGESPSLGRYGFGFSWMSFSAGNDLEGRVSNVPTPDQVFSDSQNAFMASVASTFRSNVAVGVNLKLLTQALGDASASGFGLDLALWQSQGDWAWGFVWQDVYSSLNWSTQHVDRLPTVVRVGVEWHILPDQLILAVDGNGEYSHAGEGWGEFGYQAGAEYRIARIFSVRAGLDRGRWTAGAGVNFSLSAQISAQLDYALAQERLPGAGLTHVFSLVLGFPRQVVTTDQSAGNRP